MKKLILLAVLVFVGNVGYSQISVREENTNVSLRPPQYDSLRSDFSYYDTDNIYKYKQYIGQSFYFKPISDKRKEKFDFAELIVQNEQTLKVTPPPFENSDLGVVFSNSLKNASKSQRANAQKQYDASEAKYLCKFDFKTNLYHPTITNSTELSAGKHQIPMINNDPDYLSGKSFLVLDVFSGWDINNREVISSKNRVNSELLLFKLLDENQDTLYWKTACGQIQRNNNFIVQGYFDKNKSYYVGNTVIYRDQIPYEYISRGDRKLNNDFQKILSSNKSTYIKGDILDVNTKEEVSLTNLSEWKCIDISLIPSNDIYSLYYILQDNNSKEIKIPIGKMETYGFVFKESYEKEQELRKLKQEELEALQSKEAAELKAYETQWKQKLIAKYGQNFGLKIFNGQVTLGMTKEMCVDAWGETGSKLVNSVYEIWVYSYGNSLTFKGNKLVQIISL